MKKYLLLAAGCAMTLASQAAVEVGFMDSQALGLADKPTLADNALLVETSNVTMTFLNGQEVSAQNPDFNGFKYVVVDGEQIALVQGIGGTNNGTGNLVDGPTGGCIYNFEVKEDGWLIVPSKISSNKNFYVFEGKIGQNPVAVAYTLGMDIQSEAFADVHEAVYTLPADEMGYVNLEAANIDDYTFETTTIAWPIRIATHDGAAASAGNGTGAIVFKVWKEAGNYMVLATGSKMNTCGYVFVPCNPDEYTPAVSVFCPASEGDTPRDEKTVVITKGSGSSALGTIIADENANAPMYNIYGQRVNESYKGLVIKNGVKFIN